MTGSAIASIQAGSLRRFVSGREWAAAGVVLLVVVLLRTAWVCDDAYITFRTIANFVEGAGLRWNPDERVQAFTHPLWLFVVAAPYAVTREPYFTSLALSLVFSLGAAALVVFRIAAPGWNSLVAIAALTLSKAFVDYSTSGLENPLSHFLCAAALAMFWRGGRGERMLGAALVAGLAVLNRPDLLLLVGPVAIWKYGARWPALAARAAVFAAPIALWTLFSLVYYGAPFPNTAYAKLSTGIPRLQVLEQAVWYYRESLAVDTLTLGMIAAGVAGIALKPARPAAVGLVAYLAYVLSIGGDFMSGRFFSAPFLVATAIVARHVPLTGWRTGAPVLGAFVLAGLASPRPTVLSDGYYSVQEISVHGIADERGVYYQQTGLLRKCREWRAPQIALQHHYTFAIERGRRAITAEFVGMQGFLVGRGINLVDTLGLGDPLLSRLPVTGSWRIGHFPRRLPDGYFDSVQFNDNRIADPDLRLYYDRVRVLTRGPLWSRGRLWTILRMNLGRYDHLLRAYVARAQAP